MFQYKAGLEVECNRVTVFNEINLKGTTTTTALTVKPTFDECRDEVGFETDVAMNGCDLLYTLTGNEELDGPVDIQCPVGQSITFLITTGPGTILCAYHVAPQTPKGVAKYETLGTGTTREIRLTNELSEITATRTGSILCGPATSAVATYKGWVGLFGEKSGSNEHVGIWVA